MQVRKILSDWGLNMKNIFGWSPLGLLMKVMHKYKSSFVYKMLKKTSQFPDQLFGLRNT
jgi:N6-adenosine-specific RNA methylase IME4